MNSSQSHKFLQKKFTNLEPIGEGAYGEVWKGECGGKLYAIKLCKQKYNENEEETKYYDIPYTSLREICILRKAHHMYIAK